MMRSAGILSLLVGALGLAWSGTTSGAEPAASPRVEFYTQVDELLCALQERDTNAVLRLASTLSGQTSRSGWKTAGGAIGAEARRLSHGDQDTTDAEWQRLEALCRKLLDETAVRSGDEARREHMTAETRRVLMEVLAKTEYHGTTNAGWWERYWARVYEVVMRWLEKIFATRVGERAMNIAYYIAMGVLVMPLFVLSGYLIWKTLQSREPVITTVATRAASILEPPDVYWQRAEQMLRRGELIEALKNFHLALLAGLEKRGLVVHDRTRTNWEYLAQFRQKTPTATLVVVFQSLNLVYDRAVFGAEACDARAVEQFAATTQKLLQDLGSEGVAGVNQS
jgi:hypothetical protein